MPFDPSLPATDSEMRSDEMRHQFTGLKDLIDAIPPAPPETDPVFAASEAHLFVAGDKAKLDGLPPGGGGVLGTYSTRTISLDTVYQPSPTHPVLVTISAEITANFGGSKILEIYSDASNPPTTLRAKTGLVVSAPNDKATFAVMFAVPAGHYYKLTAPASGGSVVLVTAAMEFAL
jgi:hypothetical protein